MCMQRRRVIKPSLPRLKTVARWRCTRPARMAATGVSAHSGNRQGPAAARTASVAALAALSRSTMSILMFITLGRMR